MMLQQNYFKPLKFTVRGFFFLGHLSTSPKNIFFKKESQFLSKDFQTKEHSRLTDRPISFGSGTGRLVFLSFSWQVMVSIFIRQFPTKQMAAWKIFTPRTDTKKWCCTWKMHIPPFKLWVSFRISLGWKTRKPIHFPQKTLFAHAFFRLPYVPTWRCQRRRLAGAFAGQWRAVEIARCLSEATRGAQWYSLSCRGGCLHKPFFLDPLWKVIDYK